MAPQHITFIGIGNMGNTLAQTLHKAGHSTTILNRTRHRLQVDKVIELGAEMEQEAEIAISRSGGPVMVCVLDHDAIYKDPRQGSIIMLQGWFTMVIFVTSEYSGFPLHGPVTGDLIEATALNLEEIDAMPEPVVIMVDRVPPSLLLLPGPYSVRAPIPVEPPVIPAKQTTTVGASSSFNKRQASVLNIGPLYTN
ncbi:hypothetical protein H634G_05893 [Metarhizium anisopliae BRIP 53293]|uniref:6-phosphogluconate dehydrogenase NADP-binding domain-containing protein n=1 Tax=Metarhizium anisopliae BRIP 53293 TaxID=1291518 RepID=A0A0D9NZ47_METAN|nr:hypothetical protein H634G_05893 [Metarhizium anisopliae BRIP 53293]KJK88168.1 hypothetical protein H633G_08014 [Metarhizium anisopliae BRIP 53284]